MEPKDGLQLLIKELLIELVQLCPVQWVGTIDAEHCELARMLLHLVKGRRMVISWMSYRET